MGDQNKSHLEKERKEKYENNKEKQTKVKTKEKAMLMTARTVGKDDFKQKAGQWKGNVIGDQNKTHLEKEER